MAVPNLFKEKDDKYLKVKLKVQVTDFQKDSCGSDDTVLLWTFKLTYGEPPITVGITGILPLDLMGEALYHNRK